jgi:lyso-ornithine lipid O-acyltransferase
MSSPSRRHMFRSGLKTAMLAASLAEVAASLTSRHGRPRTVRERANWLYDAACIVLKRTGIEVVAEGDPPLHGLLVSNHLSYLDVLAYASLVPCVFVAKSEVRSWPIFGSFATVAGTIFVDRRRHSGNGNPAALIETALIEGVPVVLFPEGTSSNGSRVLRFHSRFFEPATRAGALVTAAAIGYASSTADEAALAYYGDDVLAPHLTRTLGQRDLHAFVAFSAKGERYLDRKQAAHATHAEVLALRGAVAGSIPAKRNADLFRLTRAG